MSDPIILQEKQPQRFEGRNIRTPKRSGATNDIYLVSFEITREAWEALESVPKNALLEGVIWFHFGDPEPEEKTAEKPKREKKPAKEIGPYSKFWQLFCAGGRFNSHDLWQVLEVEDKEAAEVKLREVFQVSSRTFIEPSAFIAWLDKSNLDSLATVARRMEVGRDQS